MHPILRAATLLVALQDSAATIDGRVVAVADGDTITVLDSNNTQHKIRLQRAAHLVANALVAGRIRENENQFKV